MQFRDIIGHRTLIEQLIKSALGGRIAHAQLFSGPEGNQKLALAMAYAQFLNCKNKQYADKGADTNGLSADSCGKCPSCIKFEKLAHPDLHIFFPNNIGDYVKKDSQSADYLGIWRDFCIKNRFEFTYNEWVEEMGIGSRQAIINIRDCHTILEKLALKSYEAEYRVVLIWMIENLSDTISSTLLKTLEEPEPGSIFLLVSENPDQISGTILSRTQIVQVPSIDTSDMALGLEQYYAIDKTAAELLSKQTHGNLCEAIYEIRGREGEELYEGYFTQWMRSCYKVDIPVLIDLSEQFGKLGREALRVFLRFSLEKLRQCLLCNEGYTEIIKGSESQRSFIRNFSPFITSENISTYYKLLNDAIYFVARNAHIPNLMTDASLQICRLIASEKKKQNVK